MDGSGTSARRLPRLALVAVAVFGAGCRPARSPAAPTSLALAWSRPLPGSPHGVAHADGRTVVAAGSAVIALVDGAVAWTAPTPTDAGPIAAAAGVVVAGLHGAGPLDGLAAGLRGDPGAALIGLDASTGARRWLLGVGATEWVLIRAIAPAPEGFVVAGSFAGTLRIGDRVATSAGGSDGFWARVGGDGAVRDLARMGGDGADAVDGVAALPDGGLAVAGTYAAGAELVDVDLPPLFEDGAAGDGFVARLGADGALIWARSWGGPGIDACAGVAAVGDDIAVAGTVRGVLDVAGRKLVAAGNGDGLVATFDLRGAVRGAVTVGGDDYDGLTGVVAVDGAVAVTGWFSGALGDTRAAGPDDPFVAVVTADQVVAVVPIAADGPAQLRGVAAVGVGVVVALGAEGTSEVGGAAVPAGPAVIGLGR